MGVKVTFQDLLGSYASRGVVDWSLRASIAPDGRVVFYIHPATVDGTTADYEVDGNVLAHNRDIGEIG